MLPLLIFAAIVFFFDQITKRAVQTRLAGSVPGRLLQIRRVYHGERVYRRTAFRTSMVVIWCVAGLAAAWLHDSGLYFQSHIAQAGVGCALGGAAGNLLDILRRRQVVDFIDLGWWPVFNLADVAIVGGLLLALWDLVPHL
jgi:signal peptidase II